MGLIGSVVRGAVNYATAFIRAPINAARMVGNALQIVGNVITGDKAALKQNASELWDATKGFAFSAVKIGSGPVAGIFMGTMESVARPQQSWWN